MAKILLIAAAFAAAFWLLRRHRLRVDDETAPPPASSGAEDMVRCASCGVHVPRGDSIVSQQQFFCSNDHEREYRESR